MKTNAVRKLETLGIPYEQLTYEFDPNNLVATLTARKLGLPPDQVFKTLVVSGDRTGISFAVLPSSFQLDLKALASLSGDRKIETVPLKQVQPLTGYIRGGVTAIAAKKSYPVFVDEWIDIYDRIAVSAGIRGQMILLSGKDYITATNATVGAITRENMT